MQITFELAVVDYDIIELRWPVSFGRVTAEPYHAIAEALEPVKGVDRVEVLRYTAHIEIAEHVENLGTVLEDIRDHLLDDKNLAHVLAEAGVTNYGVTVCPGVVTRRNEP
jgi:pyruvate-formate lyase-activating enzyme